MSNSNNNKNSFEEAVANDAENPFAKRGLARSPTNKHKIEVTEAATSSTRVSLVVAAIDSPAIISLNGPLSGMRVVVEKLD